MSISPELQNLIDAIPQDFADPAADYLQVRKTFAPFHGQAYSDKLSVKVDTYNGVNAAYYQLSASAPPTGKTIIAMHCHGGAFVSTPMDQYHFYAEMIARELSVDVFMPDYRLAPEHRYPAAHDDCFNAYCGLLDTGVEAQQIILMGESCGGSLALGLLQRARDEGVDLPHCFISLTGWFDLSVPGPQCKERDPFLTPEWVRQRGRDYLGDNLSLTLPEASPAYADLSGFPPLYLQIGERDTMREGALQLACSAARHGVAVRTDCMPGAIHGLHGLVNAGIPEAADAWQKIRDFLQSLNASLPEDHS